MPFEQWLALTTHVVLMLGVFAWIGLGLVRALPPALAAQPVYAAAPLGFALTTAWMGILAEAGVSGRVSGGVLLAASTLVNGVWGIQALRTRSLAPSRTLARPLATALGLVLLACGAASVLLFRGTGARFGDLWGSGDFFFYWFAGDYVSAWGSAPSEVAAQQQFDPQVAAGLFVNSFRPGSYAPLSLFLWFGPADALFVFVNPLLVTQGVLILLALRLLLDVHGIHSALPLLLVVLCPMNYFGLRHSYVAQYAAVALLLFAAVGLDALSRGDRPHRLAPWMVGVVLLAGVTSYDNQFLPLGLLVAGHAVLVALRESSLRAALRTHWIPAAVLLGAVLVFSSRLISALRFFASMRPLPGWEWSRLPAPHDLLGFSTLALHDDGAPAWRPWKEVALLALLVGFGLFAMRRRLRSPAVIAALAAQCAQLLLALHYHRAGVGNASHAVWKAVSLFPLFLPLLFGVGVLELGERLRRVPARWAASLVILLVAGWQLRTLWALEPIPLWSGREFVELTRRHLGQRDLVLPALFPYFVSPITQWNERNRVRVMALAERTIPPCTPESVTLWDARAGEGGTVLDAEGPYRLGLPPHEVDFRSGPSDAWVLWGLSPGGQGRRMEDGAAVLLGTPGPELELTARSLDTSRPARVRVSLDGTLLGEAAFDGTEPRTHRFEVPPAVLERCQSLAALRLDPVPAGEQGPAALEVLRLAFRARASGASNAASAP